MAEAVCGDKFVQQRVSLPYAFDAGFSPSADRNGAALDAPDVNADQILAARYAYYNVCHSFPFADVIDCETEPEAYWWSLQHVVANPPENLRFSEDLPVGQPHLETLRTQWKNVLEDRNKWVRQTEDVLLPFWLSAPDRPDGELDKIMTAARIEGISNQQRKIIGAMVPLGDTANSDDTDVHAFTTWQLHEKSLRKANYDRFQEYIRSIRLYYEILIQSMIVHKRDTAEKRVEGDPIDPIFLRAVINNRIARVVDGSYHAIAASKAITHEQKPTNDADRDKRVRRSGGAYIEHPYESMLRLMYDTLPYYINKPSLPYLSELIAHLITVALHDIPEDSRYDEQFALETVKSLLHHFDTHFCQIFERSPNNLSMKEFLDQSLNLMIGRNDISVVLTPILRGLNKNYKLSEEEIQAALIANVAGSRTPEILGEITTPDQQWVVADGSMYNHDRPQFGCFDQFPESVEHKMDCFIVKLLAIAKAAGEHQIEDEHELIPQGSNLEKIIIWNVLSDKMEERCQNTDDMENEKEAYVFRTVRANSTRLIPFALEILRQYAKLARRGKFSFYNVLPRLIDSTLREYLKLQEKDAAKLDERDRQNITNLQQWSEEVRRYEFNDYLEDPNTEPAIVADLQRFRDEKKRQTLSAAA